MTKIFLCYILLINIYALFLMYCDKNKAKKREWRIPERKLFTIAFALGSFGIFLGMHLFRHKTKHTKFIVGIPLILLIQLFVLFKYVYHLL